MSFGPTEAIVILVIVLLLFGGRKLPELSRSIGDALRELRKGVKGDEDEKSDKEKND